MSYLISYNKQDITLLFKTLLVLILLGAPAVAQNTVYLKEDFSSRKKPKDWVLNAAGEKVAAGTCQDHKRVFAFDCQSLPPAQPNQQAKGFSGNIATIDLKNVGGANKAADSLHCLVTDTVNTLGSSYLKLAFDWQHASAGNKGTFRVQVWDGNQWQTVFVQNPDGSGRAELLIGKYSNKNLRVRFCFSTEGFVTSHMDGAAIDNIQLSNVNCPAPTALLVTEVKSTSASMRWQSATSKKQSFLVSIEGPNGHTQSLSGKSTTIKGLKADTTYQMAVKSVCPNGDTSQASKGPKFHTWCNPKEVPYAQNFDGVSPEHGSADFGRRFDWLAKSKGNSGIRLVNLANRHEPDTPPSPPNKVRFSYAGLDQSDKKLLVSPPLKGLASQQNRLRMQVAFDDPDDALYVGILANPRNTGYIQILDTLRPRLPDPTNTWKTYSVNFDDIGIIQQARHIVIANKKDHTSTFIDNMRYERLPACQKPRNLRVDKLGADSARLKWSPANNDSKWLVNYGRPSFDPTKAGKTVSVKTPEALLEGLAANQNHEAYVQAVCDNGDTSAYSFRTAFQTRCSPFQAFYQEGFDGLPLEYGEALGNRRFCWTTLTKESHKIELNAVGAKSGAKHNNSVEIEYGQYFYHERNDDPKPLLISPELTDLPTLKRGLSLDVAFDAHKTKLYAGVMKDPDDRSTFTIIDTFEPKPDQSLHEYRRFYLPLDDGSVIQDQNHVAFTAVDSFVNYGGVDGVSIDNIRYQKLPFCRTPFKFNIENVGSTSADLSWQSQGKADQWLIKMDTLGFDPNQAGKAYTVSKTQGTVNNLKPNTRYQAYVQGICSNSDSSIYKKHVTFKTDCRTPPAVLPYREGFDSFKGTYLEKTQICQSPAQWQFCSDNAHGRLRFGNVANNAKKGDKAATLDSRVSHNPTVNDLILTLNMTNYTTSKPYLLEFNYRSYGGQDKPNDQVWIRGSKNDSWISVYKLPNSSGGVYRQVGPINLTKYLKNNFQRFTKSFQVRFGQQGNYEANGHPSAGRSFDNISITRVRHDLAITAMAQPSQACGLSEEEQLSVIIENSGVEPIPANTSVEMQYKMNNRTFSSKSITTNERLEPGDTLQMTFPTSMAMDAQDTTYPIKTWLSWSADQFRSNDTMAKVIEVPDPRHRVDHVLDTSAMLKWNNAVNTKKTRVIWGARNFNPLKSSKRLSAAKGNHRISGLQPGKTYEVYTREVCGNNDTGSLRGPITFTTRTDARDLRALRVSRPIGQCEASGDDPLTLKLMNYGHDTIPAGTKLTLNYQVNSKIPIEQAYQLTQKLGPTDTLTHVLEKPLRRAEFLEGQTNQVQAWANWQQDQNPNNNRLTHSFYLANRPATPKVNDQSICRGERLVQLTAETSANAVNWYSAPDTMLVAEGSVDMKVLPDKDKTYYVSAYNHPDSCQSAYTTVQVNVQDKPEVSFSADTVCAGEPLSLEAQASVKDGTISRFTWQPEGLSSQNGRQAKVSFPSGGLYKVRLKATSSKECQASTSKNVKVRPGFDPDFTIQRIRRNTVSFFGNSKAERFHWQLGDGASSQAMKVKHTYQQPGTYQVKLKASMGPGCELTHQETIKIKAPDEQAINVYPTPVRASDPLNLTYTLPAKQDVQVQVLSLDGRQQLNQTFPDQLAGEHEMQLQMASNPGIYILQVRTGNSIYKREIVIIP